MDPRRAILGLAPLLSALLALAAGCGPSSEFAISLQTDFVPLLEFDEIRTEIDGVEEPPRRVRRADVFSTPRTLLSRTNLAVGAHHTRVSILHRGRLIAARTREFTVRGSFLVHVVITRSCRDVTCPGPADPSDATECHGGHCLSAACDPEVDTCRRGSDCDATRPCTSDTACVTPICVEGACFEQPTTGACPVGQLCAPGLGCVPAIEPAMDGGVEDPDVDAAAALRSDAGACDPRDPCCGTCAGATICCDGRCVDPLTSSEHCGRCGERCAARVAAADAFCDRGACSYTSCAPQNLDCDGDRTNGCETPFDLWSCGGCGRACMPQHVGSAFCLSSGECGYDACASGWLDCDGNRANGCETPGTGTPNCGTCGNTCAGVRNATPVCTSAGACDYAACASGWLDCDGNRANGCETPGTSTPNCGACGNTCAGVQRATPVCTSAGRCDYASCDDGAFDCDGNRANGCETPRSLANCTGCGLDCFP